MTPSDQIADHSEAGFSWCEAGEGDVILFLHPIIGTCHYWDDQLIELSEQRRCVALDAPGYGESALVGDPLAASVTDRLIAFLDHLGAERVDAVGLSLGGMYLLHAAVSAEERFGRLVLADTSAAFGIDPEPWLTDWLAPLRSGVPMAELAVDSIDSITFAPVGDAVRARLSKAFEGVSTQGFERASRHIAEHNVRELLPSVKSECLVIVGDHDDETPIEYSEELASQIPNARLEVIEGAGHLTSIEAPTVFTKLVREFVTS